MEQQAYIPMKKYSLDNPEDAKFIKEFFLQSPEFRAIEIGNKFFLQYRTLKLEKAEYEYLDEVVFYEKLADHYGCFENDKGFDSLEDAQKALLTYLNAPKTAKLHPINVNLS